MNKNLLVMVLIIIVSFLSCDKNPASSPNTNGTANTAPIASFTVNPSSGFLSTTFTYDASGSSDNEDAINVLRVRWDWNNDGTYDTNYSTTMTTTHQYTTAGTYIVKLEVIDSGGLTNTATNTINIQQQSMVVTFSDANFEALIREKLQKPTGDITNIDLSTIIQLWGGNKNIVNISGIEHCTSLDLLDLTTNEITDISALADLTNLTWLSLSGNEIIDISALSSLTNLTDLYLSGNQLTNISSLNNLVNLIVLYLNINQISDISALSGMVNLDYLHLDVNQIVNISALSGLTNLSTLILTYNLIADVSALGNLSNLKYLDLFNNKIVDISALSGLTSILRLHLYDNQIVDINALSGLITLEDLYLYRNQISDISALSNLINLRILELYGNQVSDIYPLILNNGINNGDTINLSQNPLSDTSKNTYIPELQARGATVYYSPGKVRSN